MKLLKVLLPMMLLLCFSFTATAQEVEHVRLTNLPHVYINTFSGYDIYNKTTYVYARMWYVDEQDHVAFYDSLQIRGRGNSTWNLAKKPYRIKFNQKEKFLGKGYAKTKKWTLLANHGDKTLIRNAVTSFMGEQAGLKFNPAAKFVDLTLNGNYVGNYQISDAIDVRPHRVNITEQDLPLADTSNITGGYLLEADGFKDFTNGSNGFYTNRQNVPIRIHYPDDEDIESRQYTYISQFIQAFENRLYSSDFTHASLGYRPYVDSTSLANWYICTELSGNIDGFFSTYFYKEQKDNSLYWGPLWDYDIAYANDYRKGDTSRQLMRDVGYGDLRKWIVRMWDDPWFASLINRRYKQLVASGIEDKLYQAIDSLTSLLDESVQLNYQRWGINSSTLRERVLYSTYDQYIADLKTYIRQHVPYLSTTFASLAPSEPELEPEPEPVESPFNAIPHYFYYISNVGSGTLIDIDASNDEVVGNSNSQSESQQWKLQILSNGYYHITNRATGQALNDPTAGQPTATTEIGSHLNLAISDSSDLRQQWQIVEQGSGRYNLNNAYSDHTANLSGGSRNNGTPLLSYTNDSRNSSSNNRMWRIEYADSLEIQPTHIDETPSDSYGIDYALAYDPATGRLHFGTDNISQLTFTVQVYDQAGRCLITFQASEGSYLSQLPRGIYIIAWTVDGNRRSVKLQK